MKNLLLATAFVLMSIIQLLANNASEIATLNVVLNEKSVVLNSPSQTNKIKVLTISNKFGKTIFSDIIEKNKQRIKYDLKTLPVSNYSIKLDAYNTVQIYEVVISANGATLTNSKSYFRPTVQKVNNKIVVTSEYLNDEDIQISIYDNSNDLVFRFNDQKTGAFQKLFNLEQLTQGEYSIIASTEYFRQSSKISL